MLADSVISSPVFTPESMEFCLSARLCVCLYMYIYIHTHYNFTFLPTIILNSDHLKFVLVLLCYRSHHSFMEQKIVIQLYPKRHRAQKCRSKAFTIAAQAYGVSWVEIQQDTVTVTGENIDPSGLTTLIRKKVCNASLELVEDMM
nr:heavy metal-associated isoprenylated plant protein 47-like [Ipomoea batatas]